MGSLGCLCVQPPRRCRGEAGKAERTPIKAFAHLGGEREVFAQEDQEYPRKLGKLGKLVHLGAFCWAMWAFWARLGRQTKETMSR
jgi:hypothetical protein